MVVSQGKDELAGCKVNGRVSTRFGAWARRSDTSKVRDHVVSCKIVIWIVDRVIYLRITKFHLYSNITSLPCAEKADL